MKKGNFVQKATAVQPADLLDESTTFLPQGTQRVKTKVYPNIPKKFKGGAGSYPKGYRPFCQAWSVQESDLVGENGVLPDGTYTLTQLDISINPDHFVAKVNEGFTPGQELTDEDRAELQKRVLANYDGICGVDCGHCFECSGKVENLLISTDEVFKMLLEAKELGLKNVKFLGPGELMQNPDLFKILDFFRDNDLKLGIFTKGVALGKDEIAQKIFGISSKELCEKVASYENVTILLGLTSADKATEQGRLKSRNYDDLFEIRNRVFENLASAGLNADPENQRLAIICSPVLKDNIDEVIEIYKFGLERNMPVVVAPTMLSGGGGKMKEITDREFKEKDLVELYAEIYSLLINEQILTLEQVEKEGISPYAGYACNQFVGGMLVRKDGQVMACPGNDKGEYVYDRDVRKKSLKEIWKNSMGYKMRERLVREGRLTLTQPCYAKTEELALPAADGKEKVCVKKGCGSIPEGFYGRVLDMVRVKIGAIAMAVVG